MDTTELIGRFVDAYFRFHPHLATEKGWHRYDARAPSYAKEDVEAYRAAMARCREAVEGLDTSHLRGDDFLNAELLTDQVETATFHLDVLRTLQTSPLAYVVPALEGLEYLEMPDHPRPKARDACLLSRLEGIPRLLGQAHRQVREPSEPLREAAVGMLEQTLEHLGERFGAGQVDAPLAEAATHARRAMDRYLEQLLREPVCPFTPMGEEAYLFLLRREHRVEQGIDELLDLARTTLATVDGELGRVASGTESLPTDAAPSEDFGWREVLAHYREEVEAVRRLVAKQKVVTLPRGPVVVRETPAYLREFVPGVYYLPPPAFGRSRRGHLFVPPVPRKMGPAARREQWERVQERRFRNTVVHEIWPGHHVQLLRAANHPNPLRKYRDNDVMVEGWGLYAEALMREQGLWEDDPPIRSLRALRFRAARVVVDVGIHTGRLTLEGAVDWLADLFAEEARAWLRAEVRRYAAEPTQAMSYLVGQTLVQGLREEWREAVGARFSLRDFHDRFLAEGSVPVPLIRRKMLEGAARRARRR